MIALRLLLLRTLGILFLIYECLIPGPAAQVKPTPRDLSTDARAKSASSNIPEVTSAYSRGLAMYRSGFPEYSVEVFRGAFEADRSFLLAKAAEMEAYAALSLPDHAALVERQTLREPGGKEFLRWFRSRGAESIAKPGQELRFEPPPSSYDTSDLERAHPYSQELFALALREFSLDPGDRFRILRLYSRYHSRQWEHRIVLMEHLLALVRKEDPDAPNWTSTALWSIRMENYRRGAGYAFRPAAAESDFALLLSLYPDSFAATCVRYSIALERLSDGRHAEAAALFKDVVENTAAAREVEIPCDARVNILFFAARESALAGRKEEAADFLNDATSEEQSCCTRSFPCMNCSDRPKTPVMAAIGVTYCLNRLCGKGPGWRVEPFTFGLDRSGKIFEYGGVWWDSIFPDMKSLAQALGNAGATSSDLSLEAILARIDSTSEPGTGTMLREMFVVELLTALEKEEIGGAERPSYQKWSPFFRKVPDILEYLFVHGGGKSSRIDLRDVARRLGMEYRERIPPGYLPDHMPAMCALAVRDYSSMLEILDRNRDYADLSQLCDVSRLRGIALRGLHGTGTEIEFYLQNIKRLQDMQYQNWHCYTDMVSRAITVLQREALLKVAIQTCRDAANYLEGLHVPEGKMELLERKASVLFWLGALYQELGSKVEAAATFRKVIEMTAGRNMSLYTASMDFDGGALEDDIFRLAVERLNVLR
jgi:tetratricopeptide (TPR) repeat protein